MMSRTCSGSAGMMKRWSGCWTRYQQKVFRMAVAMLRDRGRAQEVTQDIFLKLWRALPSYDGRAALSTWLYTIARNTCLTAVRAETYRRPAWRDRAVEPHAESIRPENIALRSRNRQTAGNSANDSHAVLLRRSQHRRGRVDARHAGRHDEEPSAPGQAGAERDAGVNDGMSRDSGIDPRRARR